MEQWHLLMKVWEVQSKIYVKIDRSLAVWTHRSICDSHGSTGTQQLRTRTGSLGSPAQPHKHMSVNFWVTFTQHALTVSPWTTLWFKYRLQADLRYTQDDRLTEVTLLDIKAAIYLNNMKMNSTWIHTMVLSKNRNAPLHWDINIFPSSAKQSTALSSPSIYGETRTSFRFLRDNLLNAQRVNRKYFLCLGL